MRSRSIGAILATSMVMSGCAGDGPGPGSSGTARGNNFLDRVTTATTAALGTAGAFTVQVVRRGCGDNPYVGKSPIEVLALATTYTTIATAGYAEGIARAQVALGLQQDTIRVMLGDLDALKGGVGLDAAFSSFRMIETTSAAADRLADELATRHAAEPLPAPVMAELLEANRSMHVGNHFQVDAAVGAVLLASYIADSLERGGGRELTGIMLAEVGRDSRQMVDSMTRSPATVMSMVLNLGSAYKLNRTLGEVTNFDEAIGAAELLDLDVDIRALEDVAQANARSLRSRYPEELGYRPTGQFVRGLMINALERRGVSNIISAPVLDVAFMACGGVFGGTTVVAEADPTAPLDEAGVRTAQQALIDLGHLQGRADGVPGRMTTGAVMDFQRSRGLAVDGQLTQGLLGELRLAQGVTVAPAAGPGVPSADRSASRQGGTPATVPASCVDPDDDPMSAAVKGTLGALQRGLGGLLGGAPADCI